MASVGAYNDFWTDRGPSERGAAEREGQETSSQMALVVDPPNGKLPTLTPTAARYAEELEAIRRSERPASWVEPLLQTPDHVAFLVEMIHEARIIPLDRRPHLGPNIRNMLQVSRTQEQAQALGK